MNFTALSRDIQYESLKSKGVGTINKVLESNSSNTPLVNGATYTGSVEDVSSFESVIVAAKTDKNGILYMEFSPDGTNWDSSLSFDVVANVNEVHRLTITRKYFRIRFYNDSGENQTFFRLQVILGSSPQLTSTLNSTVQLDADTLLVRPTDFTLDVTRNKISRFESFNKFGANPSVTTTIAPVTTAGVYKTPTSLTSLEFVSSSPSDTSAGSGAQEITIIGIGTDYAEVTDVIATNGVTPVPLTKQFYRVYRWYVSKSGTYATSTASSHAGTLTLRETSAGPTWSTIGLVDGLGKGQSQIGVYTVPAGKTLYIYSIDFSVETSKTMNLYLFRRENIDDVTTPYSAMRVLREYNGIVGFGSIPFKFPLIVNEKSDIGFMAEVPSTGGSISVQMDGVLELS